MTEHEIIKQLKENVNQVFVGKDDIVENLLICLITGGHILLEDVPGVGKTTLALALAKSMNASFGRIQFTPDILPSDIVGVSIYSMKEEMFMFKPGPVMNQILLGDEINRTSPKTQASLLEAMAEGHITVDGVIHPLPQPFLVIATQNPIDFMGTYPLPEAQMDRFMMRLSLGYPEMEQEIHLAKIFIEGKSIDNIQSVCNAEDVIAIRKQVTKVTVRDNMIQYMEDIVCQTRTESRYQLGASPRALLALIRASQGRAYLQGREFVKPDDVKKVVKPVLAHRLILSSEAKVQRQEVEDVLDQIVVNVKCQHDL